MITCPWCGTSYLSFQPNCQNCGGPLPPPDNPILSANANEEQPPLPPAAPRPISQKYAFRLLASDGGAIASLVFLLLGFIFLVVGAGLTLGVITAFVGVPFVLLGLLFLGVGGAVLLWRYQTANKIVSVLKQGEATRGEIIDLRENYSVTVNGRHPWVIQYRFEAGGQSHDGKVTTLNQPGPQLQSGKAVCVLYLPAAPQWNSIYPHP